MIQVSFAQLKELTIQDIEKLVRENEEREEYSAPFALRNAVNFAKREDIASWNKFAWFYQALSAVIDWTQAIEESSITEVREQLDRLFEEAKDYEIPPVSY